MKILNSLGVERKHVKALGCLVLRAVTEELWYLDMSPCSSKYFYLEKLQTLGRYSPRIGKCRKIHWPEALGEGQTLICLTWGAMPQPDPWGMSGGCTGYGHQWAVSDPRHSYQAVAFPLCSRSAEKPEHISPAANAVRRTLAFLDCSFGVIQDFFFFFCTALCAQYNNIGMETK